MKIVNKEEFYKLPENTLYSDFIPCVINDLKIKMETCYFESESNPYDFYYQSLIGNIESSNSDEYFNLLEKGLENKKSLRLDFYAIEREGLFDESSLYAVYEKEDVLELIERLLKTI